MQEISDLWLNFNETANKLAAALGRTHNIVGEYAEYIANQYYDGTLLNVSGSGADFVTESGRRYQVKARKISDDSMNTQLSVIRSWEFDYLVIILFNQRGAIKKALQVPLSVAKEYGKRNNHQNGSVITTTHKFINDQRTEDITIPLSALNEPSTL